MTVILAFAFVGALVVLGFLLRERKDTRRRIEVTAIRLSNAPPPSGKGGALRALEQLERPVPVDSLMHMRALAVLESINLGVVITSPAGETVFENPYARSFLLGRHGNAVVGGAIDEFVQRAQAGEHAKREIELYGPPRQTLFVVATPLTSANAQLLGSLVLIDDVTEQRRLDAIRRDFVTNISHELKTPIGAMSLLAETMAGEHDPEVVRALAERLENESHRLAATVDDLLELSLVEHDGTEDHSPVKIQLVVRGAEDRIRSAAEQNSVHIGVVMPDEALVVMGDARQLSTAVFNLLENAVKFADPAGGQISVRARSLGDSIEIEVQDDGVGIPRADHDRVFERFYRVDRARSRASGGTGLGLAIVRHVMINHGGAVTVESLEGEGTTFTLRLPAAAADPVTPGAIAVSDEDSARPRSEPVTDERS